MTFLIAKEEKTVMTAEDVLKKIEEHGNIYAPVDFTNCVFEEMIDLRNMEIPYPLDFQYSVFKEMLSMHSSIMQGAYIELTGVDLQKGIYLTALKTDRHDGYAVYLRKATVYGDVGLNGAGPISTLVLCDNEYYGENGRLGGGRISTKGADIARMFVRTDEDVML